MEVKHLIFSLDKEYFAIPIAQVREIIRYEGLTPIHDTIPCVRGVINLRGKIITVYDMRDRFKFSPKDYDSHTILLICEVQALNHQQYLIGLAVDAVHQVELVVEKDVRHAQDLGLHVSSEYLRGIAHCALGLTQLIDIDRVLHDLEPQIADRAKAAKTGDLADSAMMDSNSPSLDGEDTPAEEPV